VTADQGRDTAAGEPAGPSASLEYQVREDLNLLGNDDPVVRRSAIVLNDGHSEVRKNDAINPPENPGGGSAKALKNSRYWDPLQHSQE